MKNSIFLTILMVLMARQSTQEDKTYYGIDFSETCSVLDCFQTNNYTFAITRGYFSGSGLWSNVVQNLEYANSTKNQFSFVDVYFFPCRNQNGTDQVNEMITYIATNFKSSSQQNFSEERYLETKFQLADTANPAAFSSDKKFSDWRNDNVKMKDGYGIVWIDVENDTDHWDTCNWLNFTGDQNCQYLKELIQAVKNNGRVPGIYTTYYQWENIMGGLKKCDDDVVKNLPLWYSNADKPAANYSDWVDIGGWTKPAFKQYQFNSNKSCDFNVDLNVWIENSAFSNIMSYALVLSLILLAFI